MSIKCLPIKCDDSLSVIIHKIDKEFCAIPDNPPDRLVAIFCEDENPGVLTAKIKEGECLKSFIGPNQTFKLAIDIPCLVNKIVEEHSSLICNSCTTTSTTTLPPPSTTTSTSTTTTSSTTSTTTSSTTLPINIQIQNNVPEGSINSVIGATGFTFLPPLLNDEIQSGRHTGFNGSLSVTVSGGFTISSLILRRNGLDLECITTEFSGTYTFSPFVFGINDICTVEFVNVPCADYTTTTTSTTSTSTTSTTTTSTTTTSTTTTLPINVLVTNNLVGSTLTGVSNIAGFALGSPLNSGSLAQGHHTSFGSLISLFFSGVTTPGSALLYKNAVLLECIEITSSGAHLFSFHSFVEADFIHIDILDEPCSFGTTTSTTTLPIITTTTTTIPVISGHIVLSCEDEGCTEQDSTRMQITFTAPTPFPITLLFGEIYNNLGNIKAEGYQIFSVPPGVSPQAGRSHPYTITIPAGTTNTGTLGIPPSFIYTTNPIFNGFGTRLDIWQCHKCLFPLTDLYVAVQGGVAIPNFSGSYTGLSSITVHNV